MSPITVQFRKVLNFTGSIRFTYKPTSSYVPFFHFSPPTMASLEADGAPPQPPHPTMPPDSSRATHLQPSKPKFQDERSRMPQERHLTPLGTTSLVATLVGEPTTMAIPMTKAGTDATLLPAHQLKLTSFTAHPHHKNINSHRVESNKPAMQDDLKCCQRTRSHHTMT